MYSRVRFKNAKKKREIEDIICKLFNLKDINGNIIALVGNTLDIHYNTWKILLNTRSKYYVCEQIKKIYINQRKQRLKINDKDKISLNRKDIFKFIMEFPKSIAVLDLDLCATYSTLEKDIKECLEYLFKNRKFKKVNSGLTITFTLRGQQSSFQEINEFNSYINKLAISHGYTISGNLVLPYRDKSPMVELAYILRHDTNNKFKL